MTQRPTPPRKCFPRGAYGIKIPYKMVRGSVQQSFCVGSAPQKLSFVRRPPFTSVINPCLQGEERDIHDRDQHP